MSRIHLDSKFFTSETYCAKYNYLSKWECDDKEVAENGILKNPKTSYSTATTFSWTFANKGPILVPPLHTNQVTSAPATFYNATPLDIENTLDKWDTSNVTDIQAIFQFSQITKTPKWNLNKVANTYNALYGCSHLINIRFYNLGCSIDLSTCPCLTRDGIIDFFTNGIKVITTTQTITLGSTLLAKLTDEDKKIATDKGWTLAQC